MPPSLLAADRRRSLDPHVWRACAGTACKIPAAGSLVYYFPHGHCEQSSSPLNHSSISVAITRPFSLCRVLAVDLLANSESDEVFARIRLDPLSRFSSDREFGVDSTAALGGGDGGVVSFSKILTPSDANNGGGFSVPRFCADSIFPQLDFNADPPVQTVSVKDVHGNGWDFRHIYRGTPRRHLLTTGWSRFVNSKKLIAGDSVVFIRKNATGELFVGIRRTGRSCGVNFDYTKLEESSGGKDGFSRNSKGRVPRETILEAARLMEMGRLFEVLYYPRVGSAEFVVEKEVVERAMSVHWTTGMRVKMSLETEDLSRTTWFPGTVSSVAGAKDFGSRLLWRMLQITWDEPEVLQNVRTVSPWQVEIVPASPPQQAPFPALKKLRVPHCIDLRSEGRGNMFGPSAIFNSTRMGSLSPSLFDYNTFPVGMQGARHDLSVSSLSNFVPIVSENTYGIHMLHEQYGSQSDDTSSPSQETTHQHGLELFGAAACNQTRKIRKGSFQLFGQIIHMDQPVDDDSDREYLANEGGVLSLDFALSFPHDKLLSSIDIQSQRYHLGKHIHCE